METIDKALATWPATLPTKQENSSVQRALEDRLQLSEAIDLVARLIQGYPNGGKDANKGYIGILASLLCQFPKQVAIRCADPIRGVAVETKFLPTVADLVAWLERETAPLRRDAEWEIRVARQLAEREAWQAKTPSERLKVLGAAWLDRSDPIAAKMVAKDAAERESRRDAAKGQIERANEALRGRQ